MYKGQNLNSTKIPNNDKRIRFSRKNESGQILQWIKRIFSIKFLGFIVGVVGLWFTYSTFIKDKPGSFSFLAKNEILDEKINTIFYGFKMTSDSIDVERGQEIPLMINATTNIIEDLNVYAVLPRGYKFYLHPMYSIEPDSLKIGNTKHFFTCGYRQTRVGPYDGLFWPITTLFFDKKEPLVFPVNLNYTYKTKELTQIDLYIIGIPDYYNERSSSSIEKQFIEIVRPFLLSKINNRKTVLVINDKIVLSPNTKKLKQQQLTITDINQLK